MMRSSRRHQVLGPPLKIAGGEFWDFHPGAALSSVDSSRTGDRDVEREIRRSSEKGAGIDGQRRENRVDVLIKVLREALFRSKFEDSPYGHDEMPLAASSGSIESSRDDLVAQ